MISPKVLALSLLLVSPLALARVQLNATMEINDPLKKQNRTISTEVQLDADKSVTIFDGDDMRIEVKLLAEQENEAHVRYFVYAKNTDGVYEAVTSPELCAIYGDTASLIIGNKSQQGNSFKPQLNLSVKAQKV